VDAARQRQLEIFRAMTPARRWRVAEELYWSARALKEAFVRQQHPDWPEDRVTSEARRAFLHAGT
jgi:hypothetical protein